MKNVFSNIQCVFREFTSYLFMHPQKMPTDLRIEFKNNLLTLTLTFLFNNQTSYLPTITAASFCRGLSNNHTTGAGIALTEADVCMGCPHCVRPAGRCGTKETGELIRKQPVPLL